MIWSYLDIHSSSLFDDEFGGTWYLSRQMLDKFFTIAFTNFYGKRIEYIASLVETVQ